MPLPRLYRLLLTLVLALVVPLVPASAPTRLVQAMGGADLATLVILAGTVMVGNTTDPFPAVDGQIVQVGDDVWTGPDGLALLTFFDGSETQLQGDSHITLEVPAGATPGTSVSIFQSAGTTVNHVHHLSPGASFQTDTPSAVAMVRGTTYVVTVLPQPETVIDETEPTPIDVVQTPIPLSVTVADHLPPPSSDLTTSSPEPNEDSQLDAPPTDQREQLAAGFGSAPLAISSAAAITHSCQRGSPAACVTSVVLLADADGHVAHLQLLHKATQHLHDVQLATSAHAVSQHVVRAGLHPQPATPKPHG